MYKSFFGLKELPFTLTPNTDFYYGLPPHQEAIVVLEVALKSGEGFIKITGEVGTGKTLLLRKIMNSDIVDGYEIAYLPNPYLTAPEMRLALAKELNVSLTASDEISVTDAINHRLIELNRSGKKVMVLIDEAQDLPDETLEAIRLFGNLETESTKLVQIVLFGQPELDLRLAQEEFRQLRQRITFSYRLRSLTFDETKSYINYRLKVAGYQGSPLFSDKSMKKLWKGSRGIPRLINVLAHKSLMLAYGRGQYVVKPDAVRLAVNDTEDAVIKRKGVNVLLILAALMVITVAALMVQ